MEPLHGQNAGLYGGAAAWQVEADRRIEQYRTGEFTLTIVPCRPAAADQAASGHPGASGKPADPGVPGRAKLPGRTGLPGVAVRARQVRSGFLFGTCINTDLSNNSASEREYRQFIIDHFNAVVDENCMKWYSTERERGKRDFRRADAHLAFAREHGLAMRGHCLFWAKEKFVAAQPWLLELDGDDLKQAMEDHLVSIVPRYRGQLVAWDVNNEMLDGHWYRDRLDEAIRPWMFKRTAELDPDTPLFVNEYSILGNPARVEQYVALIEWLRREGAPVGGIGIQEHSCERFVLDPEADGEHEERSGSVHVTPQQVLASLDRLAELGLPIHLTEISARTPDAQARAAALDALLRIGYSHPAVEAVMLWGFWSKRHWLGPDAALVADDFAPNAAGDRLRHLLLDAWRTFSEGHADEAGTFRFRGHYGTYAVEITTADGRQAEHSVTFTPGQTAAVVTLDTPG